MVCEASEIGDYPDWMCIYEGRFKTSDGARVEIVKMVDKMIEDDKKEARRNKCDMTEYAYITLVVNLARASVTDMTEHAPVNVDD